MNKFSAAMFLVLVYVSAAMFIVCGPMSGTIKSNIILAVVMVITVITGIINIVVLFRDFRKETRNICSASGSPDESDSRTERSLDRARKRMMVMKFVPVPFFIVNFIYWIVLLIVPFGIIGYIFIPVSIILTGITVIVSGCCGLVFIRLCIRAGRLRGSRTLLHQVLQFIYVLDVFDAAYIASCEKQEKDRMHVKNPGKKAMLKALLIVIAAVLIVVAAVIGTIAVAEHYIGVNETEDEYGITRGRDPLIYAIVTEDWKGAAKAVKNGDDPNKTVKGMTALLYAVDGTNGELSYSTIDMLLDSGADVRAEAKDQAVSEDYETFYDTEGKADIPVLCYYFYYGSGNTKILKRLIAAGADVNRGDSQQKTPLMYACEGTGINGYEKEEATAIMKIKYLLQKKADVDAENKFGKTALMYAADSLDADVVRLLLDSGTDAGAADSAGKTALDHLNRTETSFLKEDMNTKKEKERCRKDADTVRKLLKGN